jgi:hypothetical protein
VMAIDLRTMTLICARSFECIRNLNRRIVNVSDKRGFPVVSRRFKSIALRCPCLLRYRRPRRASPQ